jgi:hypothetical protein
MFIPSRLHYFGAGAGAARESGGAGAEPELFLVRSTKAVFIM